MNYTFTIAPRAATIASEGTTRFGLVYDLIVTRHSGAVPVSESLAQGFSSSADARDFAKVWLQAAQAPVISIMEDDLDDSVSQ